MKKNTIQLLLGLLLSLGALLPTVSHAITITETFNFLASEGEFLVTNDTGEGLVSFIVGNDTATGTFLTNWPDAESWSHIVIDEGVAAPSGAPVVDWLGVFSAYDRVVAYWAAGATPIPDSTTQAGFIFFASAPASPFVATGVSETIYTGETVLGSGDSKDTVVPVPAAFWLFGSGLLVLAGFSRHKKTA